MGDTFDRLCKEKAKECKIKGVDPKAPIHRHPSGGLESKPVGRFDLCPGKAMIKLAQTFQHGEDRYAPNNWRLIPRRSHINHALIHLFAYIAGDDQDDHLGHALCRLSMAEEMPEDRPYDTPEAGCAKCATDWEDAKHDGDCEEKVESGVIVHYKGTPPEGTILKSRVREGPHGLEWTSGNESKGGKQ